MAGQRGYLILTFSGEYPGTLTMRSQFFYPKPFLLEWRDLVDGHGHRCCFDSSSGVPRISQLL